MTKDYYTKARLKGVFNEEFIYKAYQDTNDKDVGYSQFFTILQLYLFNKQKDYQQLVAHLVKHYDEKFNIILLIKDDKIIKVY